MFGVDSGDAGVAVNDAFVGRHLGAVIDGAIALDGIPTGVESVAGVCSQPLAQLRGIVIETVDLAVTLFEVNPSRLAPHPVSRV